MYLKTLKVGGKITLVASGQTIVIKLNKSESGQSTITIDAPDSVLIKKEERK
ncbi:MAG: hypothetical protein ACRCVX_02140 [Shewanella sp.]